MIPDTILQLQTKLRKHHDNKSKNKKHHTSFNIIKERGSNYLASQNNNLVKWIVKIGFSFSFVGHRLEDKAPQLPLFHSRG